MCQGKQKVLTLYYKLHDEKKKASTVQTTFKFY